MVKPDVYTIIVAAGSGSRFGSDVPKQFLPLCGKPVVMHAIDTFREAFPRGKVLLVLSADAMEYWHELCRQYDFESPETVCGGATRTESVHNALRQIKATGCRETDVILIHDGARPLVTAGLAARVASAPDPVNFQAIVPGYSPSDSMVRVDSGGCAPKTAADTCSCKRPRRSSRNT